VAAIEKAKPAVVSVYARVPGRGGGPEKAGHKAQ
jgi:hypothetical protein